MTDQAFFGAFGQAFLLLPYLPGNVDENARRLWELHRRHGESVVRVLDEEIRRHSVARLLDLPDNSLIRLSQLGAYPVEAASDPTEKEPSVSREAGTISDREVERPIVMAIDVARQRVLFPGGIVLGGADYRLLANLAVVHQGNEQAQLDLDDYEHVATEALAKRLGIRQPTLRQNIRRLRRRLETQFGEKHGVNIAEDDVVQNSRWDGYRLNPYVQLANPARLQSTAASREASRTKPQVSQTPDSP